jgi:hypothetical protein
MVVFPEAALLDKELLDIDARQPESNTRLY